MIEKLNAMYRLECCRCHAVIWFSEETLAEYDRESRVVLCAACEKGEA